MQPIYNTGLWAKNDIILLTCNINNTTTGTHEARSQKCSDISFFCVNLKFATLKKKSESCNLNKRMLDLHLLARQSTTDECVSWSILL